MTEITRVVYTDDPDGVRKAILRDMHRRRAMINSTDRFGEPVETDLTRELDDIIQMLERMLVRPSRDEPPPNDPSS